MISRVLSADPLVTFTDTIVRVQNLGGTNMMGTLNFMTSPDEPQQHAMRLRQQCFCIVILSYLQRDCLGTASATTCAILKSVESMMKPWSGRKEWRRGVKFCSMWTAQMGVERRVSRARNRWIRCDQSCRSHGTGSLASQGDPKRAIPSLHERPKFLVHAFDSFSKGESDAVIMRSTAQSIQ